MRNRLRAILAATAIAGLTAAAGGAHAADPYLPVTGSAQGIVVPHALPGEPTHRHSAAEPHLVAPEGITPTTGSEQGATPPNSLPGVRAQVGEAQPHADVLSPPGPVHQTGQERGPAS